MKGLGSLLSAFLTDVVKDHEVTLIFLKELWPQIVGKELARRSCPLALQGSTLRVAVQSEVWREELCDLHRMLVQSINDFWELPLVEKIEFENRLHQVGN